MINNGIAKQTPWGVVQHSVEIAPGITQVSTASHGGLMLNNIRKIQMKEKNLPAKIFYEEDCEYAFVVIAFPQFFDKKTVDYAHETCKNWNPEQYERFTGRKISIKESFKLREKKFYEDHKDDYVVITAWGDWHENCPKGMVLCLATKGGIRSSDDEKYFLVPKQEYKTRGCFGFVINQERHKAL